MKRKFLLFVSLFVTCLGFSQLPATIEGRFTTDKFGDAKLFKIVDGSPKVIATIHPNDDGRFGFNFFPEYEGFYLVGTGTESAVQGNYKFWLKPGDRLSFQINDSSYILTGKYNTKENEVLYQWYKMSWLAEWKSIYFMKTISTYVDFFPVLDKLLMDSKSWLKRQKRTGNTKFDSELNKIVKLDIALFAVNFLFTPRGAHPDKEEIPDYYKTLTVNDYFPSTKDIYFYPWGKRIFSMFLQREMQNTKNNNQSNRSDIGSMLAGRFHLAQSYIKNDTLKGDFALSQASSLKDYGDFLKFKEVIEPFILTDNQKKIEFRLSTELATLKPGDKGYEFKYEDKNGKMVSFSDFKGKVVLVDTWATWCGPCKVEIPHLKKLEKEMESKDVAIVSISVDEEKDKEKWKQMIQDENLGGVQLFAKGWSEITKYYKITGIPRFMVFDKQGKIVTVDAPRPSSPELKTLLEKYIEKPEI